MKLTYSLIITLIIALLFSLVYYLLPKSPPAYEDMTARVVELPEFKVTGFEIYDNLASGNYPKAWQKISNEVHYIDANCRGGFSYGIELYQKVTKSKWHYLAGCEMLAPQKLTENRDIKLLQELYLKTAM